MKPSGVIDSSIGIGWVHPGQATPSTDALLARVAAGETFAVPPLWFIEMANGLLVLERRKKLTRNARIQALKDLAALGLWIDPIAPTNVLTTVVDLADQHGLTVYDAIYLDTALRWGLPLATRDDQLAKAAAKAGVSPLS